MFRPKGLPMALREVLDSCEALGLSPAYFYQAWDMIHWQKAEVSSETQAALVALLLLSHKFLQVGNTCLPLRDQQGNWQVVEHFINHGIAPKAAQTYAAVIPDLLESAQWRWLFGSSSDFTPFVLTENSTLLYHQKLFLSERTFVEAFQRRLVRHPEIPSSDRVQQVLDEVLEQYPIRVGSQPMQLSPEQQLALLVALQSSVTIISGGPGTGKTSIVVLILRLLYRLGLASHVALAAPTGRAAKRMAESIEQGLKSIPSEPDTAPDQMLLERLPESQTLHRLLGYNPQSHAFRYHANNPLEHQIVIVDEASMIDMALMSKLIQALTPSVPSMAAPARLILLGDANQLPSVGAGAVLMDLVPSTPSLTASQHTLLLEQAPHLQALLASYEQTPTEIEAPGVVRLTRSYRQRKEDPQGKNILEVAHKVNVMRDQGWDFNFLFESQQEGDGVIQTIRTPEAYPWENVYFLEQDNAPHEIESFVHFWKGTFFQTPAWRALIQPLYSPELPAHQVADLDRLFEFYNQSRLLSLMRISHTGVDFLNQRFRQQLGISEEGWYAGAPIMVQQNDYDNDLFNGDQGLCLRFAHPTMGASELRVVFPTSQGYRTYYPHQLRNIQLAYAMTVHKSQGSEYEHVAIVLPAEANALLIKEMIYTAVTRAKKSVLILGKSEILQQAVFHKVQRFSGIRR